MGEQTIKPEAVVGLAEKLAGLDLTVDERGALDAMLERAADAGDEVEGYGVVFEVETTVKSEQPTGVRSADQREWVTKVGRATGADLGKLSVWTDMRP